MQPNVHRRRRKRKMPFTRRVRRFILGFTIKDKRTGKRQVDWRRTVPFVICLVVALYCGIRLIAYFTDSLARRQRDSEIAEMADMAGENEPDFPVAATEEDSAPGNAEATKPAPETGAQTDPVVSAPASVEMDMPPAPTEEPIVEPVAQLADTYQYIGDKMMDGMLALYSHNNDSIGWITISGVVKQAVVYRDNEYYLNHDFYGEESSAGTLFLDQNFPFTEDQQILLIHGHNMHDGTMFGMLSHYFNQDYLVEHCFMKYSTPYQVEYYVAFAVQKVDISENSKDDLAPYTTSSFSTVDEFYRYIDNVKAASVHKTTVDVEPGDAIIIFSTCLDENERELVFFRRVRDGETQDELKLKVSGF